MALLLGIDFESTGLEVGVVSVVEVGIVLWDTDLRLPVKLAGLIVDPGPDAVWEPDVSFKHGLTPEICAKYGMADLTALKQVLSWMNLVDAVVAHNGTLFDRPVLKHWAEKHQLDWYSGKPWIDTNCDLEMNQRSQKLSHLAADHGFLNPFPHRALFDVITMMKILDCYDVPNIVETSQSPLLKIKAIVSFADRSKASSLGYRAEYEGETFKAWLKSVRGCHLEIEREAARTSGFDIEVVKTKY